MSVENKLIKFTQELFINNKALYLRFVCQIYILSGPKKILLLGLHSFTTIYSKLELDEKY